ncbi:alkaline phosphatase family protein [Arthrobacter sp. AQ5-05]|uniref:alkaline phosphatase family protein n=1 Tax=Arthrobacter sp. AQ5-05 TaxID=2184581 RepID=UPI0018A7CD4C|nr:alkaline phosphatase family protein [Arthrobacter sp. AQ5-05]
MSMQQPSLPNYLALTSGTTAGITNDCSPGVGCTVKAPSITDQIEKSGRTEKIYAGSMPTPSLPNYVFIGPNLCNDTHECPVATGDDWPSRQVPAILASPAFTMQNSLLVITWGEGEGANNCVSTIFAGPAARWGYHSAPSIVRR